MKLFLIAIALVFSSGLRAECVEEDVSKVNFNVAMTPLVKDSTSVQVRDIVCFNKQQRTLDMSTNQKTMNLLLSATIFV